MELCKRILKKIFFLPPLPTVLISLPSFAFVCYVLCMGLDGAAAYASYGLSAYALTITTTGVVRMIRAGRRGLTELPLVKGLITSSFGKRYLGDRSFRAEISLYVSFGINMLYAIAKMVSGVLYHSVWFITLAVYYILLAVMRLLLMISTGKRKKQASSGILSEIKHYRACGVLLAVMTFALSGMILFIFRQDGGYDYPGVLIYVMAVYAFYAVITATVHLVQFRKHDSPALSAAQAINLTAALVSMLALETAMLNQFGGKDDLYFRQVMTATSGGVACALVLAMALYMIVHGGRQKKRLQAEAAHK